MAEVEERIHRIQHHEGVWGLMIVDETGKILRTTIQDKDSKMQPTQIAKDITNLAKKARSVVRDLNPMNDLTFFRVRSKNREIMVAPDKHLFLIVIQNLMDDGEK